MTTTQRFSTKASGALSGAKAAAIAAYRKTWPTSAGTAYPPRRQQAPTLPAPAAARVPAAPRPMAALEVISACRNADVLDIAEALIAENAASDVVTARISQELQARAAIVKTNTAIRTICNRIGWPELAEGYIRGRVPFDAVRAQLTIVTAKADNVEIDTFLSPDAGATKTGAGLSPSAIYAARNQAAPAVGARS